MSPAADCNLTTFYSLANAKNLQLLRSFFGCLASALHYLHDIKIRHRDIKPGNILVKGPNVYLTDFGISLNWENLTRSTTTKDTAKSLVYCAPEVARYEPRNSSSDIWSLGCVFLEMFTVIRGRTVDGMRQFFKVKRCSYRFYENISPAHEWIPELLILDLGNASDNAISNWIFLMLEENSEARIPAERLYHSIASYRDHSKNLANPFCGECCRADTFSVSESGSDGDPLAD